MKGYILITLGLIAGYCLGGTIGLGIASTVLFVIVFLFGR